MIRVTMNLTDQDIANVNFLTELPGVRNRTHAVSVSLAFTAFVAHALKRPKAQLLLRDSEGNLERIVMPELEGAQSTVAA
jgi:hypothetical protein